MNVYTIMNARIVADPFTKYDKNGKAYTELRVADNPMIRRDRGGNERKSRFVTAKLFGKQAENAGKLSKGDVVVMTGRLEIDTYTDKAGAERDKDVLIVTDFAVSKSESFYERRPEPEAAPAPDDDMPF